MPDINSLQCLPDSQHFPSIRNLKMQLLAPCTPNCNGNAGADTTASMAISTAISITIAILSISLSILALFKALFESAEGYKKCGELSIGPWSRIVWRQLLLSELRFETHFIAPKISIQQRITGDGATWGDCKTSLRNIVPLGDDKYPAKSYFFGDEPRSYAFDNCGTVLRETLGRKADADISDGWTHWLWSICACCFTSSKPQPKKEFPSDNKVSWLLLIRALYVLAKVDPEPFRIWSGISASKHLSETIAKAAHSTPTLDAPTTRTRADSPSTSLLRHSSTPGALSRVEMINAQSNPRRKFHETQSTTAGPMRLGASAKTEPTRQPWVSRSPSREVISGSRPNPLSLLGRSSLAPTAPVKRSSEE